MKYRLKHQRKASNTYFNTDSNLQIICISLVVSFVLFVIAINTNGALSDFLINVSAGVILVVFTVILVDMLRYKHKQRRFKPSLETVAHHIRTSHIRLLMEITLHNFKNNKEFKNDLIATATPQENGKSALYNMHEIYIKYCCELEKINPKELLAGKSDDYLTNSLKPIIVKLSNKLMMTRNKYDFALVDVEFNTDLMLLIDKIDYLSDSFDIIELNKATLRSLFIPSSPPLTPVGFVSIQVADYLKSYRKFYEKYYS